MSYFWMTALVIAAVEGERNRRYAESTGLLRTGIIEPVPHLGPHCRETTGYLDWVDIDDCIRYTVTKFNRGSGQKGPRTRKRHLKRATLRNVRGAGQ